MFAATGQIFFFTYVDSNQQSLMDSVYSQSTFTIETANEIEGITGNNFFARR